MIYLQYSHKISIIQLDMKTTLTEAKISVRNMSIFKEGVVIDNYSTLSIIYRIPDGTECSSLSMVGMAR